jgi:hypothetical protein
MANADISDVVPVSKNGKFFGYADKRQLKANPLLKPFDKAKAAAEIALREQKTAEEELKEQELIDKRTKKLAADQAAEEAKKLKQAEDLAAEEKALAEKEAAEAKKAAKK